MHSCFLRFPFRFRFGSSLALRGPGPLYGMHSATYAHADAREGGGGGQPGQRHIRRHRPLSGRFASARTRACAPGASRQGSCRPQARHRPAPVRPRGAGAGRWRRTGACNTALRRQRAAWPCTLHRAPRALPCGACAASPPESGSGGAAQVMPMTAPDQVGAPRASRAGRGAGPLAAGASP